MSGESPRVGPHWRIPWRNDEPDTVCVHCRFDALKGTYRANARDAARGEEKYIAAKQQNDHTAAAELVEANVCQTAIEKIVDAVITANRPARIVFPYPEFDSEDPHQNPTKIKNALPFAFAAYLADILGGEIETNIIECARPGRTKLNRFQRFAWQPRFSGEVDPNVAYILVDDNCTLGGTLAMLRTHIVGNGGTVAYVTALSRPDGRDCRFSIADATVNMLISLYTTQISPFWIEEIGHDITCLTESEGQFMAQWGSERSNDRTSVLQRLRDRIAKAKSKGK